jgi:hypothetical protein
MLKSKRSLPCPSKESHLQRLILQSSTRRLIRLPTRAILLSTRFPACIPHQLATRDGNGASIRSGGMSAFRTAKNMRCASERGINWIPTRAGASSTQTDRFDNSCPYLMSRAGLEPAISLVCRFVTFQFVTAIPFPCFAPVCSLLGTDSGTLGSPKSASY